MLEKSLNQEYWIGKVIRTQVNKACLRRQIVRATCLVYFACVLGTGSAFSQAVFGNIAGTVRDASGAAVANATITIKDIDHGQSYSVHSGTDGNYSQTHLLAGQYQVVAEGPGFGTYTANATVQVDATTRLD